LITYSTCSDVTAATDERRRPLCPGPDRRRAFIKLCIPQCPTVLSRDTIPDMTEALAFSSAMLVTAAWPLLIIQPASSLESTGPPSPTTSPTDPMPAGPRTADRPYTRHRARKLESPDGQNTGTHTRNPSPYACMAWHAHQHRLHAPPLACQQA